jgi:hypothetical protein
MNQETVIAFLKTKGWSPAGDNSKFFRFQPPEQFHFEPEFILEIPKNEESITYIRYMKLITSALADMYQIDKERLEALFSKSLEEIKTERSLTRGMMAYA